MFERTSKTGDLSWIRINENRTRNKIKTYSTRVSALGVSEQMEHRFVITLLGIVMVIIIHHRLNSSLLLSNFLGLLIRFNTMSSEHNEDRHSFMLGVIKQRQNACHHIQSLINRLAVYPALNLGFGVQTSDTLVVGHMRKIRLNGA